MSKLWHHSHGKHTHTLVHPHPYTHATHTHTSPLLHSTSTLQYGNLIDYNVTCNSSINLLINFLREVCNNVFEYNFSCTFVAIYVFPV